MAFPRLNTASFWISVPAGIIMLSSFFVDGGAAGAGWTAYAPLSAEPEYSGVHMGQVLWLVSLIILGFSSLTGAVNYITTVINLRAPGMTWFRIPLPTWALFITSWLLLLAIPILTGGLIMLLFDQTIGTGFFRPAVDGEPLLWQHIFWYFGHPEVYILILPSMGLVSEVIANRSRKPIFGYHAMVIALISIAFLGWVVWGHHMFQSGMNPLLGTTFMISTIIIAVPSAIKVFNWLGTLWRGDIHFDVPMLHALAFVSMFVIGGLSGIFMASAPVDIYIHDTYFIVAHIHYVLFGGSLFGIFAGITYYFPKMFGRMMSPTLGRIHFGLTIVAYNLVFWPMHNLGLKGHMRRIYDPNQYEYLRPLQPLNTLISIAAFVLIASQLIFAFNFFWSMFKGEPATANPWKSNTLDFARRRWCRGTATSRAARRTYTAVPTSTARPSRATTSCRSTSRRTECGSRSCPLKRAPSSTATETYHDQQRARARQEHDGEGPDLRAGHAGLRHEARDVGLPALRGDVLHLVDRVVHHPALRPPGTISPIRASS
jgi:cytochrome c oxidase subunit 1